MGDISRHRDIFLFTRESVPPQLLGSVKLAAGDLTYLEMGNYLTDVSQFRDPVTFIFAKRRIWREKVLPQTGDRVGTARIIAALTAAAALGAGQLLKKFLPSGNDEAEAIATGAAVVAGLLATVPNDLLAGIAGADEWIDKLLGTPLDKLPALDAVTASPDARKARDIQHYGYLGEFFRLFISGVSQLIFADDVSKRVSGEWGSISPVPSRRVAEVFGEFFTQYYPHEHTDQPPYVWDASQRPLRPQLYGSSQRQRDALDRPIGIMNVVDRDYIGYLAEGLSKIEDDWRALKDNDSAGRQRMLVRAGKLLHGVEDWFFHSNVVEILELRSYRPVQEAGEDDEKFLKRFVADVARRRPEFSAAGPREKVRLQRKLFRRLRFPVYNAGTKEQSAGVISTDKMSTPSLRHAYPAFPSSQDTAHTLLHALENLEHKAIGEPGQIPAWVKEGLDDKGVPIPDAVLQAALPLAVGELTSRLREEVPLILVLLSEDERRRLVANVDPAHWPLAPGAAPPAREKDAKTEIDLATARHAKALEPRVHHDGANESNYAHFVRRLAASGRLNDRGRDELLAAFEIDRTAEQLPTEAPGAGGFLMTYSLELQEQLDKGDAEGEKLDGEASSIFGLQSDNGAFNEIVGSHSLMSKDTLTSVPFFDDARVLASVASSSVFTILLQQIAIPVAGKRFAWDEMLHRLIRFPPSSGGWERVALATFRERHTIPPLADLPELVQAAASALRSAPSGAPATSKRDVLEGLYRKLELQLAGYRYP
ncbi:hypothetical protein [Microbacterium terricola]|uniref:Uncharacterized protein n=1 Tax=Microbacterium terricola TaxID=344163 RepID=A0ABM8E0Z6_9MICO|nr:hypothetical protein [Microbacterium terricola]UYK40663.1 hypothetical protein OAU46_03145 [Microbacterium terricola]BDV31603.1 hypothetical protein Microterr_22630 [Microbacterium terricola]